MKIKFRSHAELNYLDFEREAERNLIFEPTQKYCTVESWTCYVRLVIASWNRSNSATLFRPWHETGLGRMSNTSALAIFHEVDSLWAPAQFVVLNFMHGRARVDRCWHIYALTDGIR